MTLALAASNGALVLGLMVALWLVSIVRRDASLVDPWWSIGFLVIAAHSAWVTGFTPAKALLLGAVCLWAVRLWWHLLARSVGKPEDPRYAAFRAKYGAERYWWISLFQVFLLQAVLLWVISAPLQLAEAAPAPGPIGPLHIAAAGLFLVGFTFEAIADRQLQRFRDDPASRGQVLDRGLWRLSRHPNYFGEAVLWWGFGLFALDQPWGWLALLGPALMTFMLVRVSGVTMLDEHLLKSRPGYADYLRRTPAFVPTGPRS
jgi:steroid 5-alpha reductase family enzyme